MAAAAALRVWLAVRGGQLWWPDENRFDASVVTVSAAMQGNWHAAFTTLFASADHVGFRVLGLLPALGVTAGLPLWLVAVFFGMFSTASIFLIWRIALTCSGNQLVANWSAFFAATSSSLFYYSRHLVPYDAALCFGLLSIATGWRDPQAKTAFLAGVWAALGFLIYNGYWLFCGTAFLVATIAPVTGVHAIARRVLVGACGLVLPVLVTILLGLAAGSDLFRGAVTFAQTVNLGDYNEGWTFVWEYFWKTEGWLLVLWLLGVALGGLLGRNRRYFVIWLSALALVYVGLGTMSAILHQFVLYGRIARSLVPFLALICGGCAAELRSFGRKGVALQWTMAALIIVLAASHFARPLLQWYPDDFIAAGKQIVTSQPPEERIRIVNAYTLNQPVFIDDLPPGEILFTRSHPFQFEPFLYENLKPEQRNLYRSHDFAMRIVRLRQPAPGQIRISDSRFGAYPGPVRITIRLPRAGDGYSPLLATGSAKKGDFLNVTRVGQNRFRLSFVHWTNPPVVSEDFVLDETAEHILDVSFGSLLPSVNPVASGDHPEWRPLQHHLFVALDSQRVFDRPQAFHPASASEIDFGFNVFGGGTTEAVYRGQILTVTPLSPDTMLERIRGDGVAVPRKNNAPASNASATFR